MSEVTDNLPHPIWILGAGALFVLLLWYVFWAFLHPILLLVSPVFEQSADGYSGRYPDSPAQLVLYGFIILGGYAYLAILPIVYNDDTTMNDMALVIYGIFITLPVAIIKSDILPIFGINRWNPNHEPDDERS